MTLYSLSETESDKTIVRLGIREKVKQKWVPIKIIWKANKQKNNNIKIVITNRKKRKMQLLRIAEKAKIWRMKTNTKIIWETEIRRRGKTHNTTSYWSTGQEIPKKYKSYTHYPNSLYICSLSGQGTKKKRSKNAENGTLIVNSGRYPPSICT